MAAPAAEQGASSMAPGGGAVEGGTSQKVQQIEMILQELAQEEPDPDVQRVIHQMAPLVTQLQSVAGKDETEDMQSGLHNPGGEGGGEGGGPEPGEGHGKPALTIAIHAGEPKPKDFGGAKKAARQAMESGSLPSETERTANKRKG